MLENRSFDHLLGFLDHPSPRFPRLRVGEHPNPVDHRVRGSPAFGVSDDATSSLPGDPPHSHLGVRQQINGQRRPRINGFVAAYARKAAGREQLPIIHWGRIWAVVLALLAVLVRPFSRGRDGFTRVWLVAAVAFVGRRPGRSGKVHPADGRRCLRRRGHGLHGSRARTGPGHARPGVRRLHPLALLGAGGDLAQPELRPRRDLGRLRRHRDRLLRQPTVFHLLEEAGQTWRVYHHGKAHLLAFRDLWLPPRGVNWFDFTNFDAHVDAGDHRQHLRR